MRLHVGGTVILLDRKQSTVVLSLGALLFIGLFLMTSRLAAPASVVDDDDDADVRPMPIRDVLEEKLHKRHQQRRARDLPADDDDEDDGGNGNDDDDNEAAVFEKHRRNVAPAGGRKNNAAAHVRSRKAAASAVAATAAVRARTADDGAGDEIRHQIGSFRQKTRRTHDVVKMAMDDARRLQGHVIMEAQRRIITNQRRTRPDSRYNINVTLSDLTPLDRDVPDTRPPACLSRMTSQYLNETELAELPTATVIIPFYNEALSMLLRAIHSVLNKSPDRLLDEVILVDDCSTDHDLRAPLADYVRLLPKVRLISNDRRVGLVVSRMKGARLARSPVLFFVDAHAEVNVGWLEPLLVELKRNPHQVLQPFVDSIDAMTISYSRPGIYHRGSFSWDLRYTWIRVAEHIEKQAFDTGLPFFSPTLVGCAIAVQRQYFFDIGGFDEGLKVWGGENIELGFRAWMCGGQVTTVTCSRVGHVFKEFPYMFDGDKEEIVQKNLIRVAETWMDSSRKYFYATTRIYEFKRAELTDPDEIASLEERKQLRQRLKCRNFEWYLLNVMPELTPPRTDSAFHGEIKNVRTQACWQVTSDYYLGMNYVCYFHKLMPENYFTLTTDGLLRYFDRCVDTFRPPYLSVVECPTQYTATDANQRGRWDFVRVGGSGPVTGHLVFRKYHPQNSSVEINWCIQQVTNANPIYKGEQMPQLMPCVEGDSFQHWTFTYGFDWPRVPSSVLTPPL